jgi:hypothetical protein
VGERGRLWIMDYGLWIMDYGLWILDFGFWMGRRGFTAKTRRALRGEGRGERGKR